MKKTIIASSLLLALACVHGFAIAQQQQLTPEQKLGVCVRTGAEVSEQRNQAQSEVAELRGDVKLLIARIRELEAQAEAAKKQGAEPPKK